MDKNMTAVISIISVDVIKYYINYEIDCLIIK